MPETGEHSKPAVDKPAVIGPVMIDGYRVTRLEDGRDYWGLVRDFLSGRNVGERLATSGVHKRSVHLVEYGGRKYVVKVDNWPGNVWMWHWAQAVAGSYDERNMRKINRAVDEGCSVIPRMCLVALTLRWRFIRQAILVIEYVEGERVPEPSDSGAEIQDQIRDAILELHRHKLTQTDISPDNFLRTDAGIRIIDLTFRNFFFIDRLKTNFRLEQRFQVVMPKKGIIDRIGFAVLGFKFNWNKFWRRFRLKPR